MRQEEETWWWDLFLLYFWIEFIPGCLPGKLSHGHINHLHFILKLSISTNKNSIIGFSHVDTVELSRKIEIFDLFFFFFFFQRIKPYLNQ